MRHKLIAVVPARGGSKRLPEKNARLVGGKSLISRAVEAAVVSGVFDRVIVDTDSLDLAQVAVDCGAEFLFVRPSNLASDAAPSAVVLLHLVQFLEAQEGYTPDAIALIQPTSPLRTAGDIRAVVAAWLGDPSRPFASACRPLQEPRDLLIKGPSGNWQRVLAEDAGSPILFEDGSVYVTPTEYLKSNGAVFSLPPGEIVEIPALHGIDVDEDFQLVLADALSRLQDSDTV